MLVQSFVQKNILVKLRTSIFLCQNIIGNRIITLDMSYRRDIIQRSRVVKNPIVFSMIMNIKGVL